MLIKFNENVKSLGRFYFKLSRVTSLLSTRDSAHKLEQLREIKMEYLIEFIY